MNIKGEYKLDIIINTMFNTYNMSILNHNLVTNEGLNLILTNAISTDNEDCFGKVYVGSNYEEPQLDNTIDTFNDAEPLMPYNVFATDNTIKYVIDADVSKINGTREIGVWSKDDSKLISRDVHEPYDLPTSAIITLEYTFTLNNTEAELIEEEEI